MSRLEFYMIHLMPYPYIPPGEEIESSWITLSNAVYDPVVGHRLYNEYLEQLVTAERLGYDGIIVNEHHQNAYGTMPAPNLWAAWLAARTSRIRIGIIGNALPLHRNPVRVAEEIAMLDVVSGGRVISGHVRGLGAEYHSNAVNPTYSKEWFWEANDLIVKAWTEDGPFSWEGEHYHLPYVNPFPRPLQKPHPPIWLPGTGSLETIEEAARRRYAFMMSTNSQWFSKQAFDLLYRVAEDQYGYTPARNQVGRLVPTYVAETDAQAHREAMPHVMWFFRNGLKIPGHHIMPPGYMSARSLANSMAGKAKHGVKDFWAMDYDELVDQGYVIVGSPQTVIEKYAQLSDELRVGMIIGAGGHIGAMPHWMVLKNMHLMAEEVMPHFRDGDGKASWEQTEPAVPLTAAGRAAVGRDRAALPARVRVRDDQYIDCATGHLSDVPLAGTRDR